MTAGLVIAGGGLAAQRCCEVLRAAGDDRPVTIFTDEPTLPYDRPPLSKDVLAGADVDIAFRPAAWYADHGIAVRLGCSAQGLDAARRALLVDGGERMPYDDLLIATGAHARMLSGLERFGNVQVLRTRADADRLRAALAGGGPLAVVGAGLIGLEVAAGAIARGVDVTLIEAAPSPLLGVLGPRASAWLTALHRAAGVTVRLGTTVAGAVGGDAVRELRLADGARVPCAHVVVGIGVQPAVGWLAGSGIDARSVDRAGRTAAPGVFVAGDASGTAHWEAAARGGAAVARALLGRPQAAPAPPSFWSDQHGVRLVCIGDTRDAHEVPAAGDLASGSFELDHIRDGRLTAVLLAGRPPSALRAARARLTPPDITERNAA
jgi:3-phenylpropionate/trans-cinnamate dioxygenase ferredoxin reductase component